MKEQSMTCRFCDRECHIKVSLDEAGQPVSVRPEHETGTVSCPTGLHVLELLRNPKRVTRPLRRVGPKGGGNWEEISWEEAYQIAAEGLGRVLREKGPEGLLLINGFHKPLQGAVFERFANVLGAPNRLGAGNMCHQAQSQSFVDTFGFRADRRITAETRTVVLWGSNPSNTMRWVQRDIAAMKRAGGKLIVVDPLPTRMTELADLWLPIRPGADLALALGWMNLILEEGWEDRELLEKWGSGLEEVRTACRPYTLEYTAASTGLPPEQIRQAGEWLACSKPGIIFGGNALDHNWDSYQKGRAIAILLALTGNVDQPGAAVLPGLPADPVHSPRLTAADRMSPEQRRRMCGWDTALLDTARQTSGQEMLRGIEDGRLRAGWAMGADPVVMWADSCRTAQVLGKLDFFMVQDFFLTPTAQMADLVLPVATYLEYENVFFEADGAVQYRPALVTDTQAKSDMEIICGIAGRLGFQEEFWPDMERFWDFLLESRGITMAELRRVGRLGGGTVSVTPVSQGYREQGFPTEDRKIHLSLPRLREKGVDAVPVWRPLPGPDTVWPDLCTNYKSTGFFHSAGRQMPGQRALQPEPVAYVSADIAVREGLTDGDWVRVSTEVGEVRQSVRVLREMASGTISLSIGWWDPDAGTLEEGLAACCNNLTSDRKLLGREIQAFSCRGIPSRVEKISGK